jgi:hypothetical protein
MADNKKVLFILKRREDFNPVKHSPRGLSTGLFNSASYVVDMLTASGVQAKLDIAIDNNCIDRLVNAYKPTHVIIEALWVVPTKFDVLCKLHPNVKWIIRLHSEMPFMAGEGMAMDWLGDYTTYPNIIIGVNAPRMLEEVRVYLGIKNNWDKKTIKERVIYLPNSYPQQYKTKSFNKSSDDIHLACFGAIRPLKNHLLQAFAALKFANIIGKNLKFHINAGRIEMKGEPILHNLKGVFMQLAGTGHELIMHEWTPREQFLELCAKMDIGMQCNFSETFNIVSADLISQGVPIIGCSEIPWSDPKFNAKPAFSDDICNALLLTYKNPKDNVHNNQSNLTKYTCYTQKVWTQYFN